MNPGFRRRLAAQAAAYRATDSQVQYLRRLLNEAFAHHMPGRTGLDANHLQDTPRKQASFAIDRLKACKANGWKPLIENDEFWFWRGFVAGPTTRDSH